MHAVASAVPTQPTLHPIRVLWTGRRSSMHYLHLLRYSPSPATLFILDVNMFDEEAGYTSEHRHYSTVHIASIPGDEVDMLEQVGG
jgi:hypothetical protein